MFCRVTQRNQTWHAGGWGAGGLGVTLPSDVRVQKGMDMGSFSMASD